jgi:hypothetical protein
MVGEYIAACANATMLAGVELGFWVIANAVAKRAIAVGCSDAAVASLGACLSIGWCSDIIAIGDGLGSVGCWSAVFITVAGLCRIGCAKRGCCSAVLTTVAVLHPIGRSKSSNVLSSSLISVSAANRLVDAHRMVATSGGRNVAYSISTAVRAAIGLGAAQLGSALGCGTSLSSS